MGEAVWQFQAAASVNSTLAIAGDLLLVPAGGFFITSLASPPAPANELIALRLPGGPPAGTPTGTPADGATPVAMLDGSVG